MPELHSARLSEDEKRDLKRDGFVILKQAVPRTVTARAKALINQEPTRIVHGDNPVINGLYSDSVLGDVMLDAMGPHTAPINAQVAVTLPRFADAVVRHKASANSAPGAHVDGGWAGLCPLKRSQILAEGGALETWGHDGDPKSMGPAGGAPLWQDRERTVALGSYTALVAVCLNDQLRPGKGQFSVRRGAPTKRCRRSFAVSERKAVRSAAADRIGPGCSPLARTTRSRESCRRPWLRATRTPGSSTNTGRGPS